MSAQSYPRRCNNRLATGLGLIFSGVVVVLGMFPWMDVNAQGSPVYHVNARSGDDRSSGTSPAAAWRTIARANAIVQPGATVLVHEGEYREAIAPVRSGSAQRRITYRAASGETVIISNAWFLIDFRDISYVTVSGITFREPISGWGEIRNGHHNEIAGNSFVGNGKGLQTAFSGLLLYAGSSYNRIMGNQFHDWGVAESDAQWGDALRLTNAPHNLIEANTFRNAGHALLGIDAPRNIVRNNTFENRWSMAVEIAWWQSPRWAPGQEFPAYRNVFEGNMILESPYLATHPYGGPALHLAATETIVRRNVFVENDANGLLLNAWGNAPRAGGNRIYHNTFVSNGGPGVIATNWGYADVDVSDLVLKNNLFSQNDRFGSKVQILVEFWPEAQYDVSYFQSSAMVAGNCLNASPTMDVLSLDGEQLISTYQQLYPRFVTGNRAAPPRFVDPGSGDYRLQNCRCIDAGVPLTTTSGTGSGTLVPVTDASYFTNGYGLVPGDRVTIGSHADVLILEVTLADHTLLVDRTVEWKAGDPVFLGNIEGRGPDSGAFEYTPSP